MALALVAGIVATGAVVVAAVVLMVRWGSGAISPRTPGGFLAIVSSTCVLISAASAGLRPLWPGTTLGRMLFRVPTRGAPNRGNPVATAAGCGDSVELPPITVRTASTPRWPEARLVQRIERYERQGPDGAIAEAAVGRVVVHFPAGSRAAVAHVGFCPPFAATPRVAVSNECDGVEVDVSTPEVLPWGVRIECRLEEPSEEPLDVDVEIVAEPAESR